MVAVGVTGHRFLTELDQVEAGINFALTHIEDAFVVSLSVVISSLAEGTDCLVVRSVLARSHARLIVPLPLPKADYMNDFVSPQSKREFLNLLMQADEIITLPPVAAREEAYAAAGYYMLDRCDVVLAVWDGRSAPGKGGTGEIVAEARRRGLPLAWVCAGNRISGTDMPVSLGGEQGKVTFERFPEP